MGEKIFEWIKEHKGIVIGSVLGAGAGVALLLIRKDDNSGIDIDQEDKYELNNPLVDNSVKFFISDDRYMCAQVDADYKYDHDIVLINMDDPNERVKLKPISGTYKWNENE